MKWQRCTTSTPGQSISTMNAVIRFFSLPLIILDGVRAITTSSSALVPFVHHSFSPFRILFGVGMDQIHPQVAEEELAHETGRRPLLLACGFGDFARFFSADFPLLGFGESSHAALM